MHIHLRTTSTDAAGALAMLPAVRREIRAVDAEIPIVRLSTLQGHFDESTSLWAVRVGARIFSGFGAVALFLAVIGVYGVKAYTVARRTREIGIRKSLGATSGATQRLILREGLGLTTMGLVVGVVLAAGVARLLSSILYEVSSLDPVTFVSAPIVLAAAALLATWIPARRAARVAPVIALRQD